MDQKYGRYLFEYRFEGAEWALEVMAASPEEARDRLKAISWATYRGEVFAKVPIGDGAVRRAAFRIRAALGL